MKKKKVVALMLTVCMAGLLVAGCGSSASEEENSADSEKQVSDSTETGGSGSFEDAETVTLKFNSNFAVGVVQDEMPDIIAEKVSEATDGTVIIENYTNAILGTSNETVSMLMAGEVDISMHALGVFDDYNPKQSVMNAFFMFDDWDHYQRCTDTDTYKDLIAKTEEAAGVHYICDLYYATRQMMTNKKIDSVDNMSGLKFRVPSEPLPVASVQSLGASPTPMDISEVYNALQNGTVDATENSPIDLVSRAFYEVCDYLVVTNHQVQTNCFWLSDAAYSKLSDAQYEALVSVFEEVCAEYSEKQVQAEEEAFEFLYDNVEVLEIDLTPFKDAMIELWDEYEKDGTWDEGVYESFRALAE